MLVPPQLQRATTYDRLGKVVLPRPTEPLHSWRTTFVGGDPYACALALESPIISTSVNASGITSTIVTAAGGGSGAGSDELVRHLQRVPSRTLYTSSTSAANNNNNSSSSSSSNNSSTGLFTHTLRLPETTGLSTCLDVCSDAPLLIVGTNSYDTNLCFLHVDMRPSAASLSSKDTRDSSSTSSPSISSPSQAANDSAVASSVAAGAYHPRLVVKSGFGTAQPVSSVSFKGQQLLVGSERGSNIIFNVDRSRLLGFDDGSDDDPLLIPLTTFKNKLSNISSSGGNGNNGGLDIAPPGSHISSKRVIKAEFAQNSFTSGGSNSSGGGGGGGMNLFYSLQGSTVNFWDVNNNSAPIRAEKVSYQTTSSASWNPHSPGSLMAVGGVDGNITIIDLRAGSSSNSKSAVFKARNAHLSGGNGGVSDLSWNPFIPYWLASSGGTDHVVKVWDIRMPTAGRSMLTLSDNMISPQSIQWSSTHCDLLSTGSADRHWRLWSLKSIPTNDSESGELIAQSPTSNTISPLASMVTSPSNSVYNPRTSGMIPGRDESAANRGSAIRSLAQFDKQSSSGLKRIPQAQVIIDTDDSFRSSIIGIRAAPPAYSLPYGGSSFFTLTGCGEVSVHKLEPESYDMSANHRYSPVTHPDEYEAELAIYRHDILAASTLLRDILPHTSTAGSSLTYKESLSQLKPLMEAIVPKHSLDFDSFKIPSLQAQRDAERAYDERLSLLRGSSDSTNPNDKRRHSGPLLGNASSGGTLFDAASNRDSRRMSTYRYSMVDPTGGSTPMASSGSQGGGGSGSGGGGGSGNNSARSSLYTSLSGLAFSASASSRLSMAGVSDSLFIRSAASSASMSRGSSTLSPSAGSGMGRFRSGFGGGSSTVSPFFAADDTSMNDAESGMGFGSGGILDDPALLEPISTFAEDLNKYSYGLPPGVSIADVLPRLYMSSQTPGGISPLTIAKSVSGGSSSDHNLSWTSKSASTSGRGNGSHAGGSGAGGDILSLQSLSQARKVFDSVVGISIRSKVEQLARNEDWNSLANIEQDILNAMKDEPSLFEPNLIKAIIKVGMPRDCLKTLRLGLELSTIIHDAAIARQHSPSHQNGLTLADLNETIHILLSPTVFDPDAKSDGSASGSGGAGDSGNTSGSEPPSPITPTMAQKRGSSLVDDSTSMPGSIPANLTSSNASSVGPSPSSSSMGGRDLSARHAQIIRTRQIIKECIAANPDGILAMIALEIRVQEVVMSSTESGSSNDKTAENVVRAVREYMSSKNHPNPARVGGGPRASGVHGGGPGTGRPDTFSAGVLRLYHNALLKLRFYDEFIVSASEIIHNYGGYDIAQILSKPLSGIAVPKFKKQVDAVAAELARAQAGGSGAGAGGSSGGNFPGAPPAASPQAGGSGAGSAQILRMLEAKVFHITLQRLGRVLVLTRREVPGLTMGTIVQAFRQIGKGFFDQINHLATSPNQPERDRAAKEAAVMYKLLTDLVRHQVAANELGPNAREVQGAIDRLKAFLPQPQQPHNEGQVSNYI
ncbi:hypothetical protein GQ42DRAFT_74409 [Ramicandelaber brevisporus]|nr:hypothetical protein GQ42DRAFT_74409 [Ramicandelaber brevisporus]